MIMNYDDDDDDGDEDGCDDCVVLVWHHVSYSDYRCRYSYRCYYCCN